MESREMCYNFDFVHPHSKDHRFAQPMALGLVQVHRSPKPTLYQKRRTTEPKVTGSSPVGCSDVKSRVERIKALPTDVPSCY